MKKLGLIALLVFLAVGFVFAGGQAPAETMTLRYAHMNAPNSAAGMQAAKFAELVAEKTGGSINIEVYPSSQLGSIQEQGEMVASGAVAVHHTTFGALGSLYPDLAKLDAPYAYRSVEHLMHVTDVNSEIMKPLNEGLIAAHDVRILYTFYFGSRNLTTNSEVLKPADLEGMRIRAIPAPVYMATVTGLGAIATPIDWAEVPTALATGNAQGQENPIGIIYANKLYDVQSHIALTNHIMGAEVVVVNETVWQSLTNQQRSQITEAAAEASAYGTALTLESEQTGLQKLRDAGMIVIGPEEGLQVDAFRTSVQASVKAELGPDYADFYDMVDKIE